MGDWRSGRRRECTTMRGSGVVPVVRTVEGTTCEPGRRNPDRWESSKTGKRQEPGRKRFGEAFQASMPGRVSFSTGARSRVQILQFRSGSSVSGLHAASFSRSSLSAIPAKEPALSARASGSGLPAVVTLAERHRQILQMPCRPPEELPFPPPRPLHTVREGRDVSWRGADRRNPDASGPTSRRPIANVSIRIAQTGISCSLIRHDPAFPNGCWQSGSDWG